MCYCLNTVWDHSEGVDLFRIVNKLNSVMTLRQFIETFEVCFPGSRCMTHDHFFYFNMQIGLVMKFSDF